jgi:DNA end-binding protein Ku
MNVPTGNTARLRLEWWPPSNWNPWPGSSESALKELLKKKQSGQKIEAPPEREPSKVVNLMDALRRSVETERAGGERRKPAARHHRAPKKAGRSSARAKKAS